MREIVIKTVYRENGFHVIRLGNGTIHRFKSQRIARKFLADTNRFLSTRFFELNQALSELYAHYREVWIISPEIREADQLDSRIVALQETLKRSYLVATWAAGNYFSFINLRKFCEQAKSLVKFFQNVRYVKQADTLRRHKLEYLFTLVHGIEMQLLNYGQVEAYEVFSVSRLHDVNDFVFTQNQHLRITA